MSFDATWLALREPADHAARSARLAARFRDALGPEPRLLELGVGTGSNLRFLAPRLARPQRWVCLDHDRHLLAAACTSLRSWAENRGWPCQQAGDRLRVEAPFGAIDIGLVCTDLALGPPDLAYSADDGMAGVTGVTAAALLDLTSAAWLGCLAEACRDVPMLFALSFDGRLSWRPERPADDEIGRRFVAHQRTDKGFGPALGPAAAGHLAERLAAFGMAVTVERSDWRLGPRTAPLLAATLEGVIDAVAEIEPDDRLARWAEARRSQLGRRELFLEVGHLDLLATAGLAGRVKRARWSTSSTIGRTDMPRALWNGRVIAETERFEAVDGNVYFPPEALRHDLLRPSARTTVCSWKGTASYYDLVDGDALAANAVWVYRDPKPAAAAIKDHLAFYSPPVTIER